MTACTLTPLTDRAARTAVGRVAPVPAAEQRRQRGAESCPRSTHFTHIGPVPFPGSPAPEARCALGQDKGIHWLFGLAVIAIGLADVVLGTHSGHILFGLVVAFLGFVWAEIPGHWHLLPRFVEWLRSRGRNRNP